MKLLAQHELGGFGGLGEGMSLQLARDGRRILWLAHQSAPKNFTGVDGFNGEGHFWLQIGCTARGRGFKNEAGNDSRIWG